MLLTDDLTKLFEILPIFIRKALEEHPRQDTLIEVILDVGRRPEARFSNNSEYLSYQTVARQDLDYVIKRLGNFSTDNRAGIEKTLHRVSSLRNRQGLIIGLTCRIGRAIFGTLGVVRDLLEQKKSILLLGRPGVGKTTIIREIARILSDGMKKRVVIIDTSNEIAGDGDLPHPSIGKARRMHVSSTQHQDQVMIEAVENHMPEIIIIDEIGTSLEAAAARTIAERGVQLVGTAHGSALENLLKNPTITDLVGGIQYVTLGDEEAKRRGTSKSIIERKAPSTFDVAIELHDLKSWVVHENIENSVDILLQDRLLPLQYRSIIGKTNNFVNCRIANNKNEVRGNPGTILRQQDFAKKSKSKYLLKRDSSFKKVSPYKPFKKLYSLKEGFTYLYIYGINNQDLKLLIKTLRLPIILTKEIQYADVILSLANLVKNNHKLRQISHSKKITIHTIQNNSLFLIARALRLLARKNVLTPLKQKNDKAQMTKIISHDILAALEETRLVIEEIVIPQRIAIDLFPRNSTTRKKQHELIQHYQLSGVSVGKNKQKCLRIYPN